MTSPSVLDRVNEYLALRRGMGFDLDTPSWLLRDFAGMQTESASGGARDDRSRGAMGLVVAFTRPGAGHRRLSTVRVFARYLAVFDPGTEIPPVGGPE